MVFDIYYFCALALVAAELRGLLSTRRIPTPALPAGIWIGFIAALYALQVTLAYVVATTGPWPMRVVTYNVEQSYWVIALLLSAALQSYALLGLFRTRAGIAAVAVGAALMFAFSLGFPVLTNGDLYAYVGNGILASHAYAPPATAFPGEFGAINYWWGTPVPPATYGPLWLVVAHLVTSLGTSLLAKMIALRLFNACLLVVLIVLLRAYGMPARVLAIAALNPAIYFQFVLNAHNDPLPATMIVAAAIFARARPALAAALIAAAGLVKAPYALVGLPVLSRVAVPAQRYAACAFALVAAIVLSWFAGGRPYLNALMTHATGSKMEDAVHAITIVAALCAIAAGVAGARRLRTAVWLIPTIGVYITSWYAIWSLGYALGARRILIYLLVWLPFVTMLTEPALGRSWTLAVVVPAVIIVSLQMPRRRQAPLQAGPS